MDSANRRDNYIFSHDINVMLPYIQALHDQNQTRLMKNVFIGDINYI